MNQLKNQIMNQLKKLDNKSEKESIKDLKEATDPNNKSTADWYDINKFNKI